MNDYSSTWDATWNSTKDERCLELIAVSAQATSGCKADKVSATLAAGVRIPLSSARRGKREKGPAEEETKGRLRRCNTQQVPLQAELGPEPSSEGTVPPSKM